MVYLDFRPLAVEMWNSVISVVVLVVFLVVAFSALAGAAFWFKKRRGGMMGSREGDA